MNIFFPSARTRIFLAPIRFFRANLACLRIQLELSLSTFYCDVIYQFNLFSARTTLRCNAIQDITRKDYPKTLLSIELLNWVFSNDSSSYKYYIRIKKMTWKSITVIRTSLWNHAAYRLSQNKSSTTNFFTSWNFHEMILLVVILRILILNIFVLSSKDVLKIL